MATQKQLENATQSLVAKFEEASGRTVQTLSVARAGDAEFAVRVRYAEGGVFEEFPVYQDAE